MPTYQVTMTSSDSSKKDFNKIMHGERLDYVESDIVNNYLSEMPDKSTALIDDLNGKHITLITKDKTKHHWNHNGYMFSA